MASYIGGEKKLIFIWNSNILIEFKAFYILTLISLNFEKMFLKNFKWQKMEGG